MFWSKCLDSVLVKVSGWCLHEFLGSSFACEILHYQCTIKTLCFHSVLVECFGPFFFPYGFA